MVASRVTLRLPSLYPKQRDAIFNESRYGIIEASTKSGKTAGCSVWLLAQAWNGGAPGRNYWWIAPTFKQTKELGYNRIKRMLQRAERKMKVRLIASDGAVCDRDLTDKDRYEMFGGRQWDLARFHETELWIELVNGARIHFKSGENPDSLYGEDVWGAVIDEATRVRAESWYAIRSTITYTRAPVRIIGNVKGRKNWVWKLARKAEAGETDHTYAKLTAYDAVDGGILELEEIEDAKRVLPAHVFRELYLAEAAEDDTNPFGLAAIRAVTQETGWLGVGPPAAWGFDFAKSVDWTVGTALNAGGDVCGFQRWQSDWLNTLKRAQGMIANTPAFCDSTGVGDPIVEQLQRKSGSITGYQFTNRSKQQLMEGLAAAIQQRLIRVPAGPIVAELEAFEYAYTRTGVLYCAPEGMHDDCVCSLALAWACISSGGSQPPQLTTESGADDDFEDDDDFGDGWQERVGWPGEQYMRGAA